MTTRRKWTCIAAGFLFLLLALAVSHEIPRWMPGGEDQPSLGSKLRGAAKAGTWQASWEIMTGQRERVLTYNWIGAAKVTREWWPPGGPGPVGPITLPPIPVPDTLTPDDDD